MKRNGGGGAETKRRKKDSWRRHLTLGNICGMLFIVGVVGFIASFLLIGYNIHLAAGEGNEQLWKEDVNRFVRDARRADDTWAIIPHLELANQILIDHDYEPTLDEFINRALVLETYWDSVTYRKGLHFLKRDLSEWPALVITCIHAGEVVTWIIGLLGSFGIMWVGWSGMGADC